MWGDMYLFLHLQLTWDLRTNLSYVQGNINQEGEQVKKKNYSCISKWLLLYGVNIYCLNPFLLLVCPNLCHYQLPACWVLCPLFLSAGGSKYTEFKNSFIYTRTEAGMHTHTHTF